jgi:hypothetical protein
MTLDNYGHLYPDDWTRWRSKWVESVRTEESQKAS